MPGMAKNKLSPGDRVKWNTPQGKTHGKVVERVTKETRVGGTRLVGSEEDPVYVVESDKTGKRAGHKADALERKA